MNPYSASGLQQHNVSSWLGLPSPIASYLCCLARSFMLLDSSFRQLLLQHEERAAKKTKYEKYLDYSLLLDSKDARLTAVQTLSPNTVFD